MQVFCAEASSLGVHGCAASASSLERTANNGCSPRPGSTTTDSIHHPELLITPALWLADSSSAQSDDTIIKHDEMSDEAEASTELVVSVDSDSDEHRGIVDTPLNLARQSPPRRATASPALKRKSDDLVDLNQSSLTASTQIGMPPISKKGKSHRKPHHPSRSNSFLPPPPPPPLHFPTNRTNNWPTFPYAHLAHHPSYVLQSHLLALNHSLKRSTPIPSVIRPIEASPACNGDPVTPTAVPKTEKVTSESEASGSTSERRIDPGEAAHMTDKSEKLLPASTNPTNLSTTSQLMPPNYVLIRVPFLIPLPIPIPIPIPLNIHEKYLKHLLTSS